MTRLQLEKLEEKIYNETKKYNQRIEFLENQSDKRTKKYKEALVTLENEKQDFCKEEATNEVASEDLAEVKAEAEAVLEETTCPVLRTLTQETIDSLNEQIKDEVITAENVLEILYTNSELYTFENVIDMTNDDEVASDIIMDVHNKYSVGYVFDKEKTLKSVERFEVNRSHYVVDRYDVIYKYSDKEHAKSVFEQFKEELC